RARRQHTPGDVDVRSILSAPADSGQDAGLLRTGAAWLARPDIPHARGPAGPEQRLRYEVPARPVSQGEPVMDRIGGGVLPEIQLAEHLPPPHRLWRERRAASGDRGVADV